MPIYEYECPKCGRFQVQQKIKDPVLTKNPECCDKDCPNKAVRILSPVAVHFKGSGFYQTDYKPTKKKKPNETSDKTTDKDD